MHDYGTSSSSSRGSSAASPCLTTPVVREGGWQGRRGPGECWDERRGGGVVFSNQGNIAIAPANVCITAVKAAAGGNLVIHHPACLHLKGGEGKGRQMW